MHVRQIDWTRLVDAPELLGKDRKFGELRLPPRAGVNAMVSAARPAATPTQAPRGSRTPPRSPYSVGILYPRLQKPSI
jgi:hypothetical protein